MFYKVGKKITKMTEEKFNEYVTKENLNPCFIHSGLLYFIDSKGTIKAKIDKTQED